MDGGSAGILLARLPAGRLGYRGTSHDVDSLNRLERTQHEDNSNHGNVKLKWMSQAIIQKTASTGPESQRGIQPKLSFPTRKQQTTIQRSQTTSKQTQRTAYYTTSLMLLLCTLLPPYSDRAYSERALKEFVAAHSTTSGERAGRAFCTALSTASTMRTTRTIQPSQAKAIIAERMRQGANW